MCKKNHDMDNCKKFLELSVNERSRYLAKKNSVVNAMILSQVIIQLRHAPRGLYVKNVRTTIQMLFIVISTKSKKMNQEKMMMRKRKKKLKVIKSMHRKRRFQQCFYKPRN